MAYGAVSFSRRSPCKFGGAPWPDCALGLEVLQVSPFIFTLDRGCGAKNTDHCRGVKFWAASRRGRKSHLCKRSQRGTPGVASACPCVLRRCAMLRFGAAKCNFVGLLAGRHKFGVTVEISYFHCQRRKSSAGKFCANISRNLSAIAAKLTKQNGTKIWARPSLTRQRRGATPRSLRSRVVGTLWRW